MITRKLTVRTGPPGRLLVSVACALALASCSSSRNGGADSGTVQHVVFCWLKEPGNNEARQKLIDASYRLASIPGVVRVHAGQTLPSERPVVDDSFDVGIVIVLENEAALPLYLEHPLHKELLATVLQPLTERVLIYDVIEK